MTGVQTCALPISGGAPSPGAELLDVRAGELHGRSSVAHPLLVERFAAAAEKAGFLLAGSNNSRNGPMAPVHEAINLMVGDTHERYCGGR